MLTRSLKRFLNMGQTIPKARMVVVSGSNGKYNIEQEVESNSFFAGKKVILVGFPGAFTPLCEKEHIPGYVQNEAVFAEKGVKIVGLSVNDPFVLKEFAEEMGGSITFIADGGATLTRALDAGADLTEHGLGYRTRRFSVLVEDGKISLLNDEDGPGLTDISTAETILKSL